MSVFVEERLRWLEAKLSISLPVKSEQVKNFLSDSANKDNSLDFLNNEDLRRLYIGHTSSSGLVCSLLQAPPAEKCIVFLKCAHVGKVRKDSIDESIFVFDVAKGAVEHTEALMDCVFVPLILSEDGQRGERLMEGLHKLASFLQITAGNEKGEVVLPVPLLDVLLESSVINNNVVVILETTVISWTKQIRLALKLDLDEDLKNQKIVGPLAELNVWEQREQKLKSILDQINSRLASQILRELALIGNVYAKSFEIVIADIQQALEETAGNMMYLRPLKPYLLKLEQVKRSDKVISIFAPLVHLTELIWRHSKYYHEPKNFKRLLTHLSNIVVHSAHKFVGEHVLNDTKKAYANLKYALRLCAKFRGCYLDKREKANEYNKQKNDENAEKKKNEQGMQIVTGPFITMHMTRHPGMFSLTDNENHENGNKWTNSAWPPRNGACFHHLNSFMERANDVLDLVQTAQHFQNLECVAEIGGAGNKSLDTVVTEIHDRFNNAMKHFMMLTEHNVLDVRTHDDEFEKEFFVFRSLVRDLESQMAHVMRIGFDRCVNTSAQIRLLEVFTGISGRESVQNDLKDKCAGLVAGMMEEVLNVEDILGTAGNHNAPCHVNMPDAASKVCWLKALHSRLTGPMEKLRSTIPEILENDSGWKLRLHYESVTSMIKDELEKTESRWRGQINSELTSKLTLNLFLQDGDSFMIKVNLDRSLLLVLREVHYMGGQNTLPSTITSLINQVDINTLKVTAARLETIVSHYNELRTKIRSHEMALFTTKIEQMETLLEQGKTALTWKSLEVDDFIEAATSLILEDGYKQLSAIQSAQSEIEQKVAHWHEYLCQSLFTTSEPCYIEDWIVKQKEVSEGYSVLAHMYGNKISSLIKKVHKLLEISESSPAWQSYIAYLDNLISSGLIAAMRDALHQLYNLISLTSENSPQILVRVELVGGLVQYLPPIDRESADISVQEMVFSWVEQMIDYCKLIPRLAPGQMDYASLISADPDIKELVGKIKHIMDENHTACQELQEDFWKYKYLWKEDAHETFNNFISGRNTPRIPSSRHEVVSTKGSCPSEKDMSRPNSIISTSALLGQAERNFLAPSVSSSVCTLSKVPTLDDFDKQIGHYRSAYNAIAEIPEEESIGWLRVDLRPIKQVLSTHSSRWVYLFTEYLINQCNNMLGNIEGFLLETEPQIEELIHKLSTSPADAAIQPSAYMQLVELFNKVTSKQQEFDSKFGAVRKTVLLLNKYNFHMEKEAFFKAAPSRWSNLRAKVVLAKQRIAPKMQLRSEQISNDLKVFAHQCQKSREDFAACEAFLRTCTFEKAAELTKNFKLRVSLLEDQSKNLVELQELLEAHIVDFTCIAEFRADIETLEKVWTTAKNMKGHHTLWRGSCWNIANLSTISHETDCQLVELHSLSPQCHNWDVHVGLIEGINEIQACIPIIASMSNPAMRARHWKMLVRALGAQHTVTPDKFQELSLQELIDLGIIYTKDELIAISQRAETDVQMEFSLQNCEEVWLSKVFDLQQIMRKRVNILLQGEYDNAARVELVKTGRESQMLSGSFSEGRSRAFSMVSKDSKVTDSTSYKESEPVSVLVNTDSIFECLWHHEMILDSIMGPASAFSDDIAKWQKKLQTVELALKTWVTVQEKWQEMEEMFSMPGIILSLNTHARMYALVDIEFTHLMKSVADNPNVVQQCYKDGMLTNLKGMSEKLDLCEKSLIEYTQAQCGRLPRFYFLSSRDVFHIMCHSHDIPAMSVYIGKLLPNVTELGVDESSSSHAITSIVSPMGETLLMYEPIVTDVELYDWMGELFETVKRSVAADVESAMGITNNGRPTRSILDILTDTNTRVWALDHSMEAVLLTTQLELGEQMIDAAKNKENGDKTALFNLCKAMYECVESLQCTITTAGEDMKPSLTVEDLPSEGEQSMARISEGNEGVSGAVSNTAHLAPYQLQKMSSLILLILGIHNVAQRLDAENTPNLTSSFTLRSQLMYTWNGGLMTTLIDKSFNYAYEYQGTCSRIVTTPNTDRVRLSLYSACHAITGAVIIGERGLGKTESIKDISRCLGQALYMFSVTENTGYGTMVDICLGMIGSGCHVCLEGLTTLPAGVLSLLIVAIRDIMGAIKLKKETVQIKDQVIHVVPSACCFGTSLPSDTSFHILPDIAQDVLRNVCLSPHEECIIFEALLLTHGFTHAKSLSSKVLSLLTSFTSLLNTSVYSLNNAKAWFADASERREFVEPNDNSIEREEEALMLAIRDIITPRLAAGDAKLLHELLISYFPNINFDRSIEDDLAVTESRLQVAIQSTSDLGTNLSDTLYVDPKEALLAVLRNNGVRPSVELVAKLSQFALLLSTQKIVIVVGPAGSGKTKCIEAVSQAHREMGSQVCVETVVTQALKSEELFGFYNGDVNEMWTDGIFTLLLKQYSSLADSDIYNWLILDGEVTPGQLETFITLLHSDSTLLLPNCGRIKAGENVRVIWELEDLSSLSPETCASAGIFVITADPNLWQSVLRSELEGTVEGIVEIAEERIYPLVELINAGTLKYVVPQLLQSIIITFGALIKGLIKDDITESVNIEGLVTYAAAWAFGGALDAESQTRFNDWWLSRWPFPQANPESKIWDLKVGDGCVLEAECASTPNIGFFNDMNNATPFVHGHSMQRCIAAMNICSCALRPVLLLGEMGVGKTLLMREKLRASSTLEGTQLTINCDNFTDGYTLSMRLHDHMEWKAANYYDPRSSRHLICFVDNINMAKVEDTGQHTLSETIRQHIDHTFVFHKATMSQNYLRNTVYNVAGGLTTPDKKGFSKRFLRHFATFVIHYPSASELESIFTIVTKGKLSSTPHGPASHLSELSEDRLAQEEISPDLVQSVIRITIEVQERLRSMFLPTKERCHYLFTFRSLAMVFRNLLVSLKPKDNTAKDLLLLWTHEMNSGYNNRMINVVDKERFQQCFAMAAKKHFSKEDYISLTTSPDQPLFSSIIGMSDHLYSYEGGESVLRDYHALYDTTEVSARLEHNIAEFVKHHGSLHLKLYDCTIAMVCRVVHILHNSHNIGNALLVADGSSSIAYRIVCFASSILGAAVVSPTYSADSLSTYSLEDFCTDFTGAIIQAGVKSKKIVFLLQEHEISDPSFLVHVSEYISSCSVAGLFSAEEQINIGNSLRSDLTQAGLSFNHELAFQFFLKNVQDNLRVVLTTSTGSDQLWDWCSRYPSMLNCINILWLPHWDNNELLHVAEHHLAKIPNLPETERKNLGHLLANLHKTSRARLPDIGLSDQFSNATYECLVRKFVSIYLEQTQALEEKRAQLEKSLSCIKDVSLRADTLQSRLSREGVVLKEKGIGVNNILVQLGRDTAIIEAHRLMLKKQQDKVGQITQALPQLEIQRKRFESDSRNIRNTIKDTLNQLTASSLTELRALNKPDSEVEDIVVAVIMLLKSPMADLTWNKGGKRLLAGIERLIELLHQFDENELPEKALESVTQLLNGVAFSKEYSESDHAISCVPILSLWVIGVVKYHVQLQNKVQPAKMRVEKACEALEMAKQKLCVMEAKINVLQERLDGLQDSYEQATIDKDSQKTQTDEMGIKLKSAMAFTAALRTMEEMWAHELENVPVGKEYKEGAAAIGAACVAYMGDFLFDEQELLVTQYWIQCLQQHSIPATVTTDLSLTEYIISNLPGFMKSKRKPTEDLVISMSEIFSMLTKDTYLLKWDTKHGSTQAHLMALVASNTGQADVPKFPLLIDPEGIGYQRVRELEQDQKLVMIDMSNSQARAISSIGRAITLGLPVILLNIGSDVPPVMYPLFEQRIHVDGEVETIKLGGQKYQYNNKFKLYLASTLPQSQMSRTLLNHTSVIDFTLSPPLIEELMLGACVDKLFPAMGWIVQLLPQKVSALSEELARTETLLTSKLSLEVESHTDELNELLHKQDELNIQLKILLKCRTGCLNITRALEPLVKRSRLLLDALTGLKNLSSHYVAAFKTFKMWCIDALNFTAAMPDITQASVVSMSADELLAAVNTLKQPEEAEVQEMMSAVTQAVWNNVSLSLFSEDKLVASALFCLMLSTDLPELPQTVHTILAGNLDMDEGIEIKELKQEWISEKSWIALHQLETLPPLSNITDILDDTWLDWCQNWKEGTPSPGPWHGTCSSAEAEFYDILVLKLLAPVCVREALKNYVVTMQPTFSQANAPESLVKLSDGKPLLIVYDEGQNKLVNYLRAKLEEESLNFVTVGSENPDLEDLFHEGGSLILHKIQLGDKQWIEHLHQQLSVISMKLDIASQGVLGLLATLGTMAKSPPPRTNLTRCILTVHKDSVLPDTLVKFCRVVAMDTLIPPIDVLHLPSLSTTNVCVDNKCKKAMKLALLHSVILQHWKVVKGQRISISINMVNDDTAELDERDVISVLIEIVYNSIIETGEDKEFLRCLADQIFSIEDKVILDGKTVPLPDPADWDSWVEENVPVTLASVGLTESVIKSKIIERNVEMLKKLSSVLHICKIAQTSKLSEMVTVQKRIVKHMEIIPPAIPAHVKGSNIVGGTPLYNYWLSQELQCFSSMRETISSQLRSLHQKLVQGLTTLSPEQLLVYNAIYEDRPPKDWLYQNVHGSDLTLEQWLKVLTEGQQQLIRLHEGGSGMWLGSIANLTVLLQTLIHDKANADKIAPNTVTLRITLLDSIPATDRTQMVAAKGGIVVTGIQLLRAGWNMSTGTLEEDFLGFTAPLVHIYPSSEPIAEQSYMCPLYIDENIRVPVALFPMPSTVAPSHWTLLSVCLAVVRNRINTIGECRPKVSTSPVTSSLFQLQSKANLLCSKQLVRSSSFAAPPPKPQLTQRSVSMTPASSHAISTTPATSIPNRLQPTPPTGTPRSRRTSVASQILERKSKSSSRGNSPKLVSPLADMERRSSMTRQSPPASPSSGTAGHSPTRAPALVAPESDEEFGDTSVPVSPASTAGEDNDGAPDKSITPSGAVSLSGVGPPHIITHSSQKEQPEPPKTEKSLVSITPKLQITTPGSSLQPSATEPPTMNVEAQNIESHAPIKTTDTNIPSKTSDVPHTSEDASKHTLTPTKPPSLVGTPTSLSEESAGEPSDTETDNVRLLRETPSSETRATHSQGEDVSKPKSVISTAEEQVSRTPSKAGKVSTPDVSKGRSSASSKKSVKSVGGAKPETLKSEGKAPERKSTSRRATKVDLSPAASRSGSRGSVVSKKSQSGNIK